ncbi:BLUF domain-containing protein [Croceicoccus bisphenolivorans]|uniref:BLUF domain-containing protein n=1 Tax=Croceicoccus bisphenolivorans TaxID=1783232 RepID=UPI0008324ED5|nr:BLUF domain-containing protein [Croceicoccus bisphenolivorans]
MRQLLYTSTATPDITERDVRLIVGASQYRNAIEEITGILLFDGQRFLQFVEGAGPAITALMHRLYGDPRHGDIVVRHDVMVERRTFPIWSMRWVHLADRVEARRETIGRTIPTTLDSKVQREVHGFASLG